MDLELKDKVVVITGGSKGIGLGIARAFASEGAHVVLTARTKSEVEKAAAEIKEEYGVKATAVSSDVATVAGCEAVIAAAEAAGGADIFISNAGTGTDETVANASDEKWQYFWDLHVMAAVRISRALALQMEKKGGGAIDKHRLDLRCAAIGLRADLQHHQGSADDVFEMPLERTHREKYPCEHDQSGAHPNAGLGVACATRACRVRLAELSRRHCREAGADQTLRVGQGSRRILRFPLFASSQLYRRLGAACRWRLVEYRLKGARGPYIFRTLRLSPPG